MVVQLIRLHAFYSDDPSLNRILDNEVRRMGLPESQIFLLKKMTIPSVARVWVDNSKSQLFLPQSPTLHCQVCHHNCPNLRTLTVGGSTNCTASLQFNKTGFNRFSTIQITTFFFFFNQIQSC